MTLASSVITLSAPHALAYEVETHEEISGRAATISVLGRGSVLGDIGAGTLNTSLGGRTLLGWIRFGAREEDNTFYTTRLARYLNHFYNPLTGEGYKFPGATNPPAFVYPSPTWGLEDFEGDNPIVLQNYSYQNALNYFYSGLTLPNKADRDKNFGLTFRTLGQVIHLIQDAAQPQHTRNDSHGSGSLFEKITNELILSLPYSGYPASKPNVMFDRARSFWHTLPPARDRRAVRNLYQDPDAQGVAEYSNRGFVTAGTNFRFTSTGALATDPDFPMPAPDSNSAWSANVGAIAQTFQNCGVQPAIPQPILLNGQLTFYKNFVADSYDPTRSAENPYTTTLSIFDADLQRVDGRRSGRFFTLNRFNYCAAHEFLIPRAVGYSAGMIDYFFRGRLEVSATAQSNVLTLNVTNSSSNVLSNGQFELYYDAADGTRKPLTISGENQISASGVVNGANLTLTTNCPADVANTQQPYILLFSGSIGVEKGLAVKTFNVRCEGTPGIRRIPEWTNQFTLEICGSSSCSIQSGSGVVNSGGGGGAVNFYGVALTLYNPNQNPAKLPLGSPADYNFFEDVSYYYVFALVLDPTLSNIIYVDVHPYSNSDMITFTNEFGLRFTLSFTATKTGRLVCLTSTGINQCPQ
jgi:hypothetical protein